MLNQNQIDDLLAKEKQLESQVRFLRENLRRIRDDAECGAGLDSDNRKAFLESIYNAAENALLVTEETK